MRKNAKDYLFNIAISVITLFSFFMTIKIDNDSRLPQNINTDYHMNSLPYIYIILICLTSLVILNLYKFIKVRKAD